MIYSKKTHLIGRVTLLLLVRNISNHYTACSKNSQDCIYIKCPSLYIWMVFQWIICVCEAKKHTCRFGREYAEVSHIHFRICN